MGIVYKAHDPKIDRKVAIKTIFLLDLPPAEDREYRERFRTEARTAGRLSHPGIVAIFDVDANPEDAAPYIVMEYVDGHPLSRILEENKGKLPLGPALTLAQEVAEALHVAHGQGIIHRDIKPENIFVTTEGRAKISDFGVARPDQGHLTLAGRILGSPAYMSPEQLDGKNVDARSDLFSLGVVLYTMLTGHRPFQGNSTATVCFKVANRDPLPVSTWNSEFPLELDALVTRAMAKNPAERFQTGMEMAQELQRFRETHLVEPQPLASIMRIIGQESVAIAETVISERKAGSDFVNVAEPIATKSHKEQSAGAALLVKATNTNKDLVKPATQPRFPKAIGVAAAGLFLIASWAVWSTAARHPQGNGAASAVIAAKVADSPAEVAPVQPRAGGDIAEGSTVPAAKSSTRTKRVSASAKNAQASSQRRTAAASKKFVYQAVNSPENKTEASAAADPAIAHIIHQSDLSVTIEHSFQDAQASIFVDDRMVRTEDLHGQKKRRALVFTHTQGSQSSMITLVPGKHDIAVRVQSAADGFDATQKLTQSFAPGSNRWLVVKCDKHRKRIELAIR
jgi:serine/threonine protein kinase